MQCRATQERRIMVESSDKMWSPGEVSDKPLQYSCLENPMNSMKRQKERKGRGREMAGGRGEHLGRGSSAGKPPRVKAVSERWSVKVPANS